MILLGEGMEWNLHCLENKRKIDEVKNSRSTGKTRTENYFKGLDTQHKTHVGTKEITNEMTLVKKKEKN